MRKRYGKYGLLGVLVLALLLALQLAAGPASATTTTLNKTQGFMMGELYPGDFEVYSDGTLHVWDWVAYTVTVRATGPDGAGRRRRVADPTQCRHHAEVRPARSCG